MSAGMISLAVHYPRRWMPNEYWSKNHPDMVRRIEDSVLNRIWKSGQKKEKLLFDQAMECYASDPFFGVKNRRWLEPGETALSIETKAARAALEAASLTPQDIDLCIVGSFFPDNLDTGNAPWLARALELPDGAWNLESACSSSVLGYKTAAGLVESGQHKRILVVNSCTYSRYAPETERISLANGDGASAFVVSKVPDGYGYLGGYTKHTGISCGALSWHTEVVDNNVQIRMRANKNAGKVLSEMSEPMLHECVDKALEYSKLTMNQIDFFIFNTPMAWFSDFCVRSLGISKQKTIDMHHMYANTGPVMMPTNLLHAAHKGLLHKGDIVLLFSIGSVSSSAAAIMKWDTTNLGQLPSSIGENVRPGDLI